MSCSLLQFSSILDRNNSWHVIKEHLIGHCGSQNTSAVHSVKCSTMENLESQLLESNSQVLSSLKYKHIHIFLILLYLSPGLSSVPLQTLIVSMEDPFCLVLFTSVKPVQLVYSTARKKLSLKKK